VLTLTDVLLDLGDAERHAATLREYLHAVERAGNRDRIVAGRLAMTERRIDRLTAQRKLLLAAIDTLAERITALALADMPHDAEERRALDLLGCESLDADRWPYAAAALRAREEPTAVTMTAFYRARQVLWAGGRRAA
jgi:hypothetical protein